MLKKSREVSLSNGRGEKRDGKLEKRGGHSHNEVGRRTGIFCRKVGRTSGQGRTMGQHTVIKLNDTPHTLHIPRVSVEQKGGPGAEAIPSIFI